MSVSEKKQDKTEEGAKEKTSDKKGECVKSPEEKNKRRGEDRRIDNRRKLVRRRD